MKILHICNDYCGSKVHANLYRQLDVLGVKQTIFTYYRKGKGTEGENAFTSERTCFLYREILKKRHRLLYHVKIKHVYNDLLKTINPQDYTVCHATTLFSDGAIAYQLFRDYGIPYCVAARSTDIDEFLRVAPHTWPLGLKILRNASKIFFISKSSKDKICKHPIIRKILPEIQNRFCIQPNGIDDYWLDHICYDHKNFNHNVIYVGQFIKRKNVIRLIDAVLELQRVIPDIHLHLVGGGGVYEKKVQALSKKYSDILTYHGKIQDKNVLRNIYRMCSVFAMPSVRETFGLVYVEAITQGLTVVYTRGEGFDGLLDKRVGEKLNTVSKKNICDALLKVILHRDCYSGNEVVDFEFFRWKNIAERYMALYTKMTGNGTH